MSVESSVSPSSASPQSSDSQSEIVPAFMLAALIAITGVEAMMVMATPHRVAAHTLTHPLRVAMVSSRH